VVPVLVLTGYLGSGKTTLLAHLLRQPDFARTAVIVNEFGEIGLDHELVEASDDSFVALTTGCLCCKVRDDLVQTIDDLLRRRDAGRVPPFGRIVIETSGLADPAPILQTLMTDPSIAGRIVLGGVATTVDAVHAAHTLGREPICAKQVAVADRLIVTKSDLVGLADVASTVLRDRLAELNPAAPVLEARHGRIDPRTLFDAGPYDPGTKSLDVQSWLGKMDSAGDIPSPSHAQDHVHDHAIRTYALLRDPPIRAVTLTLLLETLAEHCGADLLRLKGIVNIAESPQQPAVIHGVQHVFHAPGWLARWPSDDRRSRIVVITRGIPRGFIEALIDALEMEVCEVSAGSRRGDAPAAPLNPPSPRWP
jgi:G3E family GTPase